MTTISSLMGWVGPLVIVLSLPTVGAAQTPITWADFTATTKNCWVKHPPKTPICFTHRVNLPDGDLIDFSIEPGAAAPNAVEFRLVAGPFVTWWKEIIIASTLTTDIWRVWTKDGMSFCNWPSPETSSCNRIGEWSGIALSPYAFIIFSKAKEFGEHRPVYVLGDLAARLRQGDRVTFTWIKD